MKCVEGYRFGAIDRRTWMGSKDGKIPKLLFPLKVYVLMVRVDELIIRHCGIIVEREKKRV